MKPGGILKRYVLGGREGPEWFIPMRQWDNDLHWPNAPGMWRMVALCGSDEQMTGRL